MPSPAFYQTMWEQGHQRAADAMLFATIRHLRGKRQQVSASDAIAASTLAHGLRALRGHDVLARVDVLDGLAGALVKDALEAPLPWTRRGTLAARTDPLLVEIVAAFAGDRVGRLAHETPQPPLVHDAFSELARVGLSATHAPSRVRVDIVSENGARQSAVLHRLRVLAIPGFVLTRAPSLSRAKTELSEEWSITRLLETDPALIEAALFGATLGSAASAKLEQQSREATGVRELADVLFDAALCGISALTQRCLADISHLIAIEPSFDALGSAVNRLLSLRRGDLVLGARGQIALGEVLAACFDRGLWLFEGIQGASAPLDEGHVRAVRALRDLMRMEHGALNVDPERARELCERRAKDPDAPPALRGAALGLLWSTRDPQDDSPPDERRATSVLRSVARPGTLGDFLGGLFALAREEVVRVHGLLATIDGLVSAFPHDEFLIALPALRQAFAFFPPRERLAIAESILKLGGDGGVDPMQLVGASIDVATVQRGATVDRASTILAERFGLTDQLDADIST